MRNSQKPSVATGESEWGAGGCVRQGLCVHACMLSHSGHVPDLCDLVDCSLPGSSQARILAWVIMPPSPGIFNSGINLLPLMSPALAVQTYL